MSVETSNAPKRFAAVIDPTHPGVMDDENTVVAGLNAAYRDVEQARAKATYLDQGFNRTRPDRVHQVVEYLRADLVVPTVDDEMVDAAAWIVARDVGYPYLSDVPDGEWQAITSQAREILTAVHALLLSRIEGADDAR